MKEAGRERESALAGQGVEGCTSRRSAVNTEKAILAAHKGLGAKSARFSSATSRRLCVPADDLALLIIASHRICQ